MNQFWIQFNIFSGNEDKWLKNEMCKNLKHDKKSHFNISVDSDFY